MTGQTVSGMSDIVGCSGDGVSVWVELKSKGRRKTLRPGQHEFLLRKIGCHCFAVCVDSVEMLATVWDEYQNIESRQDRVRFLKNHLPIPYKKGEDEFDDEFGF